MSSPVASALKPTPRAWLDFISPLEGEGALQLAFGEPLRVLSTRDLGEVRSVIDAAHEQALAGRWVLGFVRYEAAPAFDAAAVVCADTSQPLLAWFAVFEAPLAQSPKAQPPAHAPTLHWPDGPLRAEFDRQLAVIHEAIRQGQVYQVNLTATLQAQSSPSLGPQDGLAGQSLDAPLPQAVQVQALFEALRRAQPRAYAAWLDAGEEQVLSVSPELFFHWEQGGILCRPMKGTAARGATPEEDAEQARRLTQTEKERAENLMIVDLIRNDLSRLALPHTVKVPRLFEATAWPTVWQMTSDVRAQTRPGLRLSEVFEALFPCGSVTGAPKWQAMKLIAELERQPRGVYCGAVGVIRPGGSATFNVPIRTLGLRDGQAHCGIGSGITLDAQAQGEWEEWRSKRAFLERARQPFELLETLAWRQGQFRHLQAHLARMQAAARHFGFEWQEAKALEALHQAVSNPSGKAGEWLRLRLCSNARGEFRAQAEAVEPVQGPVRVALASRPMEPVALDFLRFKTTRRAHYEAWAPQESGVFDTLLWNAKGELTEFTRGNVMLRLGGVWVTPATGSGLLGGVGRQQALRDGAPDGRAVQERVLHLGDMAQASELAFVNSLRGWIACEWPPGQPVGLILR
jgi:para-aminobenzoate synthetase/4-amino-4-deoxychorismate lyase